MNRAALFILAALVYLLWPYDAVPDFAVIVGWLDDLLVALLALYMAGRALQQGLRDGPRKAGRRYRGAAGARRRARGGAALPAEPRVSDDPYEVLGIRRGASPEEIKRAYRREMTKYHPDKVRHLGEELQSLADKRAKAIQSAYERLSS